MYLFLIFGLPLGFVLLTIYAYPSAERSDTRKAFYRGLASFVPIWIVARILGAIVPEIYGSPLLALHEWADRILPYCALPAAAYLVFYKPSEGLGVGREKRRFTAFYSGALAPVGLFETVRIWGSPDPYVLFLLPLVLAAACVIMPHVARSLYDGYGLDLILPIAAAIAASLVVALLPFLFLIRLWPLALIAVGALCALAWFRYYPDLEERTPVSYSD
jgi:hypothetical protein